MIIGRRQAVIVGVNEYEDPNIKHLPGAKNDAEEIYYKLKDPDIGNFEIPEDHFLVGEVATCKNIRKAISDIFWKEDYVDLALFYFSGHGFTDGYGNGYIAPYDMVYESPLACGINMHDLTQIISSSVNKQSAMSILDCCYSGIATTHDKPIPDPDDAVRKVQEQLKFKSTEKTSTGEGRIILASSARDQTTKEINDCTHDSKISPHPHGVYTFFLLEGLEGKAASKTGILTLEEIRSYVERRMSTLEKGKYRPTFSMEGARQIDDINIAVAYPKYKEYTTGLLEQLQTSLTNTNIDAASIINSAYSMRFIKNIDFTHTTDPGLSTIKENLNNTKDLINRRLEKYKEKIGEWLFVNEDNIRSDIDRIDYGLYQKFYQLENFLNLERLIEANKSDIKLLKIICDAIEYPNDNPNPTVVEKIRKWKFFRNVG